MNLRAVLYSYGREGKGWLCPPAASQLGSNSCFFFFWRDGQKGRKVVGWLGREGGGEEEEEAVLFVI